MRHLFDAWRTARYIGVVGLTTALEIQQRGKGKYRVTVVADVFPGDPNTGVKYTSQWAVRVIAVIRRLPFVVEAVT